MSELASNLAQVFPCWCALFSGKILQIMLIDDEIALRKFILCFTNFWNTCRQQSFVFSIYILKFCACFYYLTMWKMVQFPFHWYHARHIFELLIKHIFISKTNTLCRERFSFLSSEIAANFITWHLLITLVSNLDWIFPCEFIMCFEKMEQIKQLNDEKILSLGFVSWVFIKFLNHCCFHLDIVF